MPDWSYQTVLRPLLFRLRPEAGRDFALGSMGRLARLPGGVQVIRLLGHMAPDRRLRLERAGLEFPSPVGLGCRLDPRLTATRALAEFGAGFLEIGPITSDSPAGHPLPAGPIQRISDNESLLLAAPQASLTMAGARAKLAALGKPRIPILARIEPASAIEAEAMIAGRPRSVSALVVPLANLDSAFVGSHAPKTPPLLLAITADDWRDPARRLRCEQAARNEQVAGIVIDPPTLPDGSLQLGKPGAADARETIRAVRAAVGPGPVLIAGVGIHEPADALDTIAAGADLVTVDSGLVLTGPGLVKRINEALLYRQQQSEPAPATNAQPAEGRLAAESWFWALLLGLSLLGGGVLALGIAATRVVLPYDEALSGLTRDQLAAINPKLLAFMTHDRVTLAGTMLAVGLLYSALAYFGIRRGLHWAHTTVATSALAGFFTFFAFLGFGYFDPFHAFTSAILLQLTFMAMHAHMPPRRATAAPELHNDEAWRSLQWGQLLFVIHGAVIIVAGLVITGVGMTQVFVKEDLEFLQTTAEALNAAHPQLKPLVAHDRATFGGMLIACGLATLLPALWGFRRGERWLWWTLMLSGNIAYIAALAVHLDVGYSSHLHLLPVYGGLAWLWAGGLFSYPFMAGSQESLDAEWQLRLG
jgi:dihydroorotate dehydrogenase